MPFSIRLRLDPVLAAAAGSGGGAAAVRARGVTLSFTLMGAGTTLAARDSQVPARIEFVGRFTTSVRDRPAPEEFPMGELAGEVELKGQPPTVVFRCDAASLKTLTEPPPEIPEEEADENPAFTPRSLDLKFGAAFEKLEAAEGQPTRLHLPKNAGTFRYLELVARLTVAGAVEADVAQNDVLDALIRIEPVQPYPFSL